MPGNGLPDDSDINRFFTARPFRRFDVEDGEDPVTALLQNQLPCLGEQIVRTKRKHNRHTLTAFKKARPQCKGARLCFHGARVKVKGRNTGAPTSATEPDCELADPLNSARRSMRRYWRREWDQNSNLGA
jgi:hypothetical protein